MADSSGDNDSAVPLFKRPTPREPAEYLPG